MESASIGATYGGRPALGRPPLARLPDRALKWGLTALATGILILIGFFFVRLYIEADPAFQKFGFFGYTLTNNWDVQGNQFGALPLLVGTLITSGVALAIGVPVALATALFTTEFCPPRYRGVLAATVDLLAAVPSVVYGLWGFFVLIPKLRPFEQWLSDTFSFLPFVGGHVAGPSYFIAGLVLAIMIVPIVSAITREVIANEFGEAASDPLHRAALIAAGLLLFVLTLIVNAVARGVIVRGPGRRGTPEEAFGVAG